MKKIDKFENQARICNEIEQMIVDKSMSYMDAVILYCEEKELEIEYVAKIISNDTNIRVKIEEEAESLNFMKPRYRLPF